jgi:hypothetical protein
MDGGMINPPSSILVTDSAQSSVSNRLLGRPSGWIGA